MCMNRSGSTSATTGHEAAREWRSPGSDAWSYEATGEKWTGVAWGSARAPSRLQGVGMAAAPVEAEGRCGEEEALQAAAEKRGYRLRAAAEQAARQCNAVEVQRCPMRISDGDTRFHTRRRERFIRCDGCESWCCGNAVGAFADRDQKPAARVREAWWWRGQWDATWYCMACWRRYLVVKDDAAVYAEFGWTERAAKKARFCGRSP